MANPQKEDGHVDLANEIVEALAKIRISGEEMQCLWVIFRKTYGWHKKEDPISFSQISEMTGLKRPHVIRAIKKLVSKKVLCSTNNGTSYINIYRFNKDFDEWVHGTKKGTSGTNNGTKVVPIMVPKLVPKKVHTKEKKENIQKKEYGEFKNVGLTDEEHQKLVTKFGELGTKNRIEDLSTGIQSKGYRYKDHYATILSWERKYVREHGDRPKSRWD